MFLRSMCALVYILIHTRLHIVIYEKSFLFSYAPYYHFNHQLNNRVLLFKTYSCAPLKYIFDYTSFLLMRVWEAIDWPWRSNLFFCLSILFFYVFITSLGTLFYSYVCMYSRQSTFFCTSKCCAWYWNTPSLNKINISNIP